MMNVRQFNSRKTGIAALVGAAIAASVPGMALAQDAAAIEEMIVTAQKREERLQDVPIAISAISKAQLEKRGVEDVLDLKALAPNLLVSKYPNSNVVSQVAIRGGVTVNAAMYWEPSTGMYLDGVYLGKAVGSVFDVVDLERVEVLRGPQGTLYGRNTMAGAVNLITKKPTGEFGGSAKLELGNYGYHTERVSVDLPKMGIARASFALRSEKRDGLVKLSDSSPGDELDSRDKLGARFALALDIADNFVADYAYDYTDIDQAPPHSQLYHVTPTTALFTEAATLASTKRLGKVATNWPGYEQLELEGHALTLTWEIDEHNTLKSISAYRDLKNDDSVDLDGTRLTIATANRISDFEQKSQELQLVGDVADLNYVVGLYYYKDEGDTVNPHVFFFGTDSSEYGFGAEAKAAYAQLDWHATEQLTLSGGLRYTDEDKDTWRFKSATIPSQRIPFTSASESFSDTTPMVSAAYAFSDELNVYVKYSEGFKSGGFQGESATAAEAVVPYDPEKQSTWEIGAKSTLLDGTLQLNAAVFHNTIEDMHVTQFSGSPGVSYVRNAGEATTQGFELEATWAPIEQLRLQASYGYLDAEWDEFMEAPKVGQPVTNVASNRSFPHAPEHTLNVSADALLGATEWGEIRAFLDWSYTSEFNAYAYQIDQVDPARAVAGNSEIDSYGLLNAKVSLSEIPLGDGAGEFALWARNVTDDRQPVNYIDFGPGFFAGYRLAYYQEPRTYGVSFVYDW
ncbi:MAG: Vitamin B12 transporter BtuB [Pseudomonadales bacterium]|nr:Vitamin B12 transporter BtuB [Pseudomonadales bacterium]